MRLRWLGEKDKCVTWGVPHAKGTVKSGTQFLLKDGEKSFRLQTRENAYWDDGSVKWTLHSAAELSAAAEYELMCGSVCDINAPRIVVAETDEKITVDTGAISVVIKRSGTDFIESMSVGGKARCSCGRLVMRCENRFETEGYGTRSVESFTGEISECFIEEKGDVRAVVRVRGTHVCANNRFHNSKQRKLLPFDVRLYFYAGSAEMRIVHTFLFDGQQNTDFICALGIEFDISMRGALYNRYVRFAGERGLYVDSPKGLLTWRTTGKYHEMYEKQNRCEPLKFDENEDVKFLGLLDEAAVWNDFKISQLSSEEYVIEKRTQKGCVYIKGHSGHRALGGGYLGDAFGGIAVHMDKFWQKYPSGIEILGTAGENATLTMWLWSPDAKPMDLRHYDTRAHVQSGYEGFDEIRATPYGIANTNEMTIKLYAENPSNTEALAWISHKNNDILLVPVDLEDYRSAGALGIWSMDKREGRQKALEEHNDALIEHYKREREIRRWYGFWDFGDFMHTYDDVRHCWKYDMGGQAWQNTELVPNLWLWYGFLRSGRADLFELARAMTRHTSEVDMYHIGEYAPLGSRHNVVHWGCACKEARISMAHLHKIFYYLTGDERTGDILDETADADFAVGKLDPMRAYYPPDTKFAAHIRFGPDVMAFCSNWFTYWERHRDERYLDKLKKTMSFFKQKHRAVLSGVYGYNPHTTEYFDFSVEGGSHFMHCFGNFYVWLEIANCFGDTDFLERMADLGQFYGESEKNKRFREQKCREWGFEFNELEGADRFEHKSYDAAIGAFAAALRGDGELAEEIWRTVENDEWAPVGFDVKTVDSEKCHKVLKEAPAISTNGAAQWGSNFYTAMYYLNEK